MKRDMDLVRAILKEFESNEDKTWLPKLSIEGYSDALVQHHIEIMSDAGLLQPVFGSHSSSKLYYEKICGYRLGWDGHEFLDASRDESRWKQAKGIMTKIGGATLEIMKQILAQLMAEQVKQYMGMNP